MRARVIGLGQAAAGDDAVGHAVLEEPSRGGPREGLELRIAAEASALVPLLSVAAPVILVDAVLATPGEVLHLTAEQVIDGGIASVSTHGIGVAQAIRLARLLDPDGVAADLHLVAVGIAK